jgi:Flp pilus assembly protein TadD
LTSLELNKLHVYAQKLINQGQFKQAHETCLAILKLAPRHADCHFLLGIIAANLGQMSKAIGLIDLATKLNNNNAEYFCFLAKCQSSVNRSQEAHTAMTRAIQLSSDDALVNDTLGVVASRLGDHKLAITLFEKAISIRPDNASFYYNLAASQKFLGDFQQAEASYEKVISLQADYFQAHSALAELMQVTKEHNHIERLLALKKRCQNNVNAQLHICHALAKEWECLGQYIPALEALQHGNAAKKQQLKYSIDTDQRLFSTLKSCFESWPNLTQLTGSSSKKPIFIVGMPRSGTTLVDRIISSHSAVISAGELQNFGVELKKLTLTRSRQVLDEETILAAKKLDFQQLAQRYLESTKPLSEQSPYFIDKMPLNFLYIGFIKKAFPQAKIIIMRRNAMDTCLSNFRTLFAVNFSYYNYSYDLMDTARYFELFSELMNYWKSLFKEQLMEVVYEDLVEKPEEQIRRILDYCELSWQPACLNFQDNEQAVSTASSVQVRKPMNTDSIDRWKRYGNKLDELRDYLDSKHLL